MQLMGTIADKLNYTWTKKQELVEIINKKFSDAGKSAGLTANSSLATINAKVNELVMERTKILAFGTLNPNNSSFSISYNPYGLTITKSGSGRSVTISYGDKSPYIFYMSNHFVTLEPSVVSGPAASDMVVRVSRSSNSTSFHCTAGSLGTNTELIWYITYLV